MPYVFSPPTQLPPGAWYRFDTASGSDSPAAVFNASGGTAVDPVQQVNNGGRLPRVSTTSTPTLYLKQLDYRGKAGAVVPGSAVELVGALQGGGAPPGQVDLSDYLKKADATAAYAQINDARLSNQRTPIDGSVTDTKVVSGGLSQSRITGLTAALGAKADLVGGQIPTSQVPALALHTGVAVANRAAMLALTSAQVQPGDVASVASDPGKGTYQLQADDPSQLANWLLLNAPTDLVQSVNGQNGVVNLAKADVGLGNVDNTSDANKPISTATSTALANKATTEYVDTTTAPASLVTQFTAFKDDPHQLGFVAGATIFFVGAGQTWSGANDAKFVRVVSAGTISKIGIQVETASGNISVAVYRRSGTGRGAAPGTRVATSGAIACPAAGYTEVSLGASVRVEVGDFLALSCDNTTAVLTSTGGSSRGIYQPMFYGMSTAHPLPATASGVFGTGSKVPLLVGAV